MTKLAQAEAPLGRQALKAQRTRENLIGAVVSLIKEGGFAAASSSRIAERAGMTWGAVQHHYGSKEDILEAVLARAYEQFIDKMTAPGLDQGNLEQRVSLLVDRMWSHYQTDYWLVSFEILLATRGDGQHPARAWEDRQGKAHVGILRNLMQGAKLSDSRLREALTFTHCCLSGLRVEHIFETRVRGVDRYLARVKASLLDMLQG